MMIGRNQLALRQRSEMDANSPTSRFRFVKLFEFKNRNNPLDLDLEGVPAASGIDLRFLQKNLLVCHLPSSKMKEFCTSIWDHLCDIERPINPSTIHLSSIKETGLLVILLLAITISLTAKSSCFLQPFYLLHKDLTMSQAIFLAP